AALLQQARLVIELASRATESARLAAHQKKGPLRIATIAGALDDVAGLLKRFERRHPEVEVELFPGLTRQNLAALERRTVDVAVVHHPFDGPGDVRYLRLGATELLIAIPAGHRLASLDRVPRSE